MSGCILYVLSLIHILYDNNTQLYYLNSRYYDPETGRFINADAMVSTDSLLGANLYAYCYNNPVNLCDPDGYNPLLGYGSSGSWVKTLQEMLNSKGYNLAVDGIFGPKTKAAVKSYQKAHGLKVDGLVGDETWGSLNKKTTFLYIPSTKDSLKSTLGDFRCV